MVHLHVSPKSVFLLTTGSRAQIKVRFSPANVPADCINLGQGFMNWAPPDWIRAESHGSMDHDIMTNHYSHPRGRPRLLKAISKHYSPQFENIVARGKDLTNEEILVTAGANCGELCFDSIQMHKGVELIWKKVCLPHSRRTVSPEMKSFVSNPTLTSTLLLSTSKVPNPSLFLFTLLPAKVSSMAETGRSTWMNLLLRSLPRPRR